MRQVPPRTILLPIDTWDQVNGITVLYRAVMSTLDRHFSGRCRIIVAYPAERPDERVFGNGHMCIGVVPRVRFRVPQYPDLITGYFPDDELRDIERRHGRADVIHLPTQGLAGFSGARFARRHGRPCVGFYHTEWPRFVTAYLPAWLPSTLRQGLGQTIAGFIDRQVYGRCGTIVAHSPRSLPSLPASLRGSVVMAPEFADLGRFLREDAVRPRRRGKATVFGYVGRLAREKRLDRILSHAAHISARGGHLLMVGDGPERGRIAHLPNLELTGWQSGDALLDGYRRMTYLLMPADSDTLGLVLLEAGAAGVPAVALRGTVAGNCIERYQSGVVVEEFTEAVFEQLMALAETPAFDRMRDQAVRMARAHDITIGTRKLLDMWEQSAIFGASPSRVAPTPFITSSTTPTLVNLPDQIAG